MALTAPATNGHRGSASNSFVVTSGVTIYKGALVAMEYGTGTVDNYNDESNHIPIGFMTGPGNSVTGDGTLTINVDLTGKIMTSVTVTGTSAATDNFAPVYATDEATFTLTRPSVDSQVVGVVLKWISSTTCDVLLLDVHSSIVLGLAGGNKKRLDLGVIHTTALEGTAAAVLINDLSLWGHGQIVAWYARPTGFDASYAAGSQTLTLDINGSQVPSSSLVVLYTDIDAIGDVGTAKSATMTTGHEFNDGDTIDVDLASGGTGFTDLDQGDKVSFFLYADVVYLPAG